MKRIKCITCMRFWGFHKQLIKCDEHMTVDKGIYSPVVRRMKKKCKGYRPAPEFMQNYQRELFAFHFEQKAKVYS